MSKELRFRVHTRFFHGSPGPLALMVCLGAMKKVADLQSGASGLRLGWVDLDLGSSPGWWAASIATYCPSRMVEHPKSKLRSRCEKYTTMCFSINMNCLFNHHHDRVHFWVSNSPELVDSICCTQVPPALSRNLSHIAYEKTAGVNVVTTNEHHETARTIPDSITGLKRSYHILQELGRVYDVKSLPISISKKKISTMRPG